MSSLDDKSDIKNDFNKAIKKVFYKMNKIGNKKILEAIQKQSDQQQNNNPVHIAIDKGSIAYRRRIEELIKSETSFTP